MTTTMTKPSKQTYVEEDVGNIVALEHINVQVADQQVATLFYLVGMGFTRDPHMMVGLENMWANLGEQQCHLPTNPEHPQTLRGHIGLVTPSLDALVERLDGVKARLEGTKFGYTRGEEVVDVTCPWGNHFRCYEPGPEFGRITMGIPYVEFMVPTGTADGIAAFYDKALDAPSKVAKDGGSKVAVIDIGQYQHLLFRETEGAIPAYDGHHLAIYIANFSKAHKFFADRDLVTEAPMNHQFRFKEIVHPKTGENLFTIEHEVRGMRHLLFQRPLVNRTIGQFAEPRRIGNRTILGSVM